MVFYSRILLATPSVEIKQQVVSARSLLVASTSPTRRSRLRLLSLVTPAGLQTTKGTEFRVATATKPAVATTAYLTFNAVTGYQATPVDAFVNG